MTFIHTACGHELHLTSPRPGAITAHGIAHSLAQINRFTGHCSRPYSVAEHSLLVVTIMQNELAIHCPHALLAGLMHDAHEAYTGDLHTPGKRVVGPAWDRFESTLCQAVRSAFALHTASSLHADAIKRADLIALATEKRDLLPHTEATSTPWASLTGVHGLTWLRLNDPHRAALSWADWRDAWLDQYEELDFARNESLTVTP